MTTSANKKKYNQKYVQDHYKRVALNLSNDFYADLQSAATAAGESVSAYIRQAIEMRMKSDKN